jgi:hypothetical protein
MSYRPNPESLAARVIGYFALNPDATLTLDDVLTTFVPSGSAQNVHTQLMDAMDHGMVVWLPERAVYIKGDVPMPSVLERDPTTPAAPKRAGSWPKKPKDVEADAELRPLDTANQGGDEHPDSEVGQAVTPSVPSPIDTVRQHLMETLKALRDPTNPMPLDRAKVVAEVATVLVNTAKVEVDYLKTTKQRRGRFFESATPQLGAP